MRLNLKLGHKAFILISVPLVCEALFVATLVVKLNEANEAKKVLAASTHITGSLFDAGKKLYLYSVTKHDSLLSAYDQSDHAIQESFADLKYYLSGSRERLQVTARLEKTATLARAHMSEARRLCELGEIERAKETLLQVKPLGDELQKNMGELVAPYEHIEAGAQETLLSTLYCGLALNVGVSVWLALFFNGGTTRRLAVLMDNIARFKKGAELSAATGGTDEIAELDATFRVMVEERKELERLKQEFMSMVSHDLRTPLTSLRCSLEMLSDGCYGPLSDTALASTRREQVNCERLIGLINELLDIDKLESGTIELELLVVPASELMTRSIDSVVSFASEKSVTLVSEDADGIDVVADPDRIVQVLVNLISNAVKFSPAGSTVRLQAKALDTQVEISVSDSGRGIASNQQEMIFERFKQVNREDNTKMGGAGLGLSICRNIVEAHKGTIGVESELGHGSRFWFRLPRPLAGADD